MSRFLMYGTLLGKIEQLMMVSPNFSPRRRGIVINNYFNSVGGVLNCNCSGSSERGKYYTDIYFYFNHSVPNSPIF